MEQDTFLMKRVEPLSFSMGCLDGCEQNSESPYSNHTKSSPLATNSLNRRKVKLRVERDGVRRSWGPSDKEEGNQEFWASIREPYDFIMGTHLIPDSYELERKELFSTSTEMEPSWDPEDVSLPYVWSLSEFLDQYNELYEWLIHVQLKLYSHSNPPDKHVRLAQQEELDRRAFRRKLFVEQGERIAQKYPLEGEEIQWRVNYLNNKWDQLLTTLTPLKGRAEELEVELDLAHEEDLLCKWLSAMESQIQPITCRLPRGCSLHALQERFKDNQILLKDIEAHGPILKSVIRQYERLASAEADPSRNQPPSTETLPANSPVSHSDTLSSKSKTRGSTSAVPRRAKSLEKRWHQIYLRSLEWHYYLEGVIASFKEQEWSCTSDSEDEPVTKCRRLSFSSSSCDSPHQSRRKARHPGWSDYDANSSEAGSYIEDDYVSMTNSEAISPKGGLARKNLSLTCNRKTDRNRSYTEGSPIGIGTMRVNSAERKENGNASSTQLLLPGEENCNHSLINKDNNDNNSSPKNENVTEACNHTSPQTSRLNKADRPSPNFGVFDYKYHDTDSDNNNGDSKTVLSEEQVTREVTVRVQRNYPIRTSNFCKKVDFSHDEEEEDPDELQKIIDMATPDDHDWLNSNITTDTEESLVEENEFGESRCEKHQESMDTGSEENTIPKESRDPIQSRVSPTPCDKKSIHRLISDAEQLVREPISISPRTSLKPLSFVVAEDAKHRRVRHWLNSQPAESLVAVMGAHTTSLQDSCDASGELTTGESDFSDNDLDISSATQKGSGDLLPSSENTPTLEGLPPLSPDHNDKAALHNKKWLAKKQKSYSDIQKVVATHSPSELSTSPVMPEAPRTSTPPTKPLPLVESTQNRSQTSSSETTTKPLSETATPPAVASNERISTSLPNSGNLKSKRIKFRRRSHQLLALRTDSGSEDLLCSKFGGRSKDSKWQMHCSPYHHSVTKNLSSDSESVSGCPRVVKSSSFSGECGGENGVMTSSTEKCLSDSSHVSSKPQSNPTDVAATENSQDNLVPNCSPTPGADDGLVIAPRNALALDQETTHQEDVSSLSEQAWDPYQEFKTFSEPYSEDLDRDGARKLLYFDDDYRNLIDSDGCSFVGLPYRRRRSPHHRKMRTYAYRNLDSDSDLEDLHHVIAESNSQLTAIEEGLKNFSNQATLGMYYGELVSTIRTNLKCLQDILKHLHMEAPDLQSERNSVKSMVERWETLQVKVAERQRQSTQLRQLQRQVKNLRLSMEKVVSQCSAFTQSHTLDDPSQIGHKVEVAKSLLEETENLRNDLASLNVMVHRFTSEIGSTFTPLKDEMAELYRLWDETNRRVNAELSRLQSAEATWRLWEEQKAELCQALKQDSDTLKIIDAAIDSGRLTETVTASVHDVAKLLNERRLHPTEMKARTQTSAGDIAGKESKTRLEFGRKDDRLSDSGTSGYESCSSDDLSERERRLAYLRRLARDLEVSLVPGSKAWNDISSTLAEAEKELKGLQDQCRNLLLRTAETLDPSSKQPRFSSNSRRRSWARENKNCRSPRVERRTKNAAPRREWIWRVVRAALPFQAALLLLLCVACLLEPNCCNSVNTLNSFAPQLRFVQGSLPV